MVQYRGHINETKDATKDGYYYVGPASSGFPYAFGHLINLSQGVYGESGEKAQIFISTGLDKKIYYRSLVGNTWGDWKSLATAEAPIRHDFIPLNGLEIGYPSTYKKNQFNELTISFAFVKPVNVSLTNGSVVAWLPEGFRLTTHTVVPGLCAIADVIHPIYFTVSGDGGIRIYSPPDTNGKAAVLYATQHI